MTFRTIGFFVAIVGILFSTTPCLASGNDQSELAVIFGKWWEEEVEVNAYTTTSIPFLTVEDKLAQLKLELPFPMSMAGNYEPYKVVGQTVCLSGVLPYADEKLKYTGKLGVGTATDKEGYEAAQLCALNMLAYLKEATGGDFVNVKTCISLHGSINTGPDYGEHSYVMNGASNLITSVFPGERGGHTRSVVGVASLPHKALFQLEGEFQLKKK